MLNRASGPRILARAQDLPLRDESIDLLICSMMLAYALDAFPELVRVVRPGGSIFVTDLHPEAVARGWTRGFRIENDILQPAHSSYTVEDLPLDGLEALHFAEAKFGEPELPLFEPAMGDNP